MKKKKCIFMNRQFIRFCNLNSVSLLLGELQLETPQGECHTKEALFAANEIVGNNFQSSDSPAEVSGFLLSRVSDEYSERGALSLRVKAGRR